MARKIIEYRKYEIDDAPDNLSLRRWIEEGVAMSGIFCDETPLITTERCGESTIMWWYKRYCLPQKGDDAYGPLVHKGYARKVNRNKKDVIFKN